MLGNLWNTIFYEPLYNALFFIVNLIPGGDIGIAIIILTLIVKFVLYPLSKKSITSQVKMKELEPEIRKIKEEHKEKSEQAKQTFALYKKYKINPMSGCLPILIQLPIIFALYWVFYKGLNGVAGPLYSFVSMPVYNINFLGLVDMNGHSIIIALIAGVFQFFQAKISSPKTAPTAPSSGKPSFQDDLAKSMGWQMKYFLPVFIAFIAYKVSAAVALYWAASNIFSVIQELIVRRKLAKNLPTSDIGRTYVGGR